MRVQSNKPMPTVGKEWLEMLASFPGCPPFIQSPIPKEEGESGQLGY